MSMLQILKRSPFILLIICVDLMYLLLMILPSNATDIFLDIILPALYLLSIVCVFFLNKEENGDYALIKISLIGKLALIPWFGVNAFCNGIKKDITPVKNAISLCVSSGFVEGNNNKFKVIKRIVYGRGGLVNLEKKCKLAFLSKQEDFSLSALL